MAVSSLLYDGRESEIHMKRKGKREQFEQVMVHKRQRLYIYKLQITFSGNLPCIYSAIGTR